MSPNVSSADSQGHSYVAQGHELSLCETEEEELEEAEPRLKLVQSHGVKVMGHGVMGWGLVNRAEISGKSNCWNWTKSNSRFLFHFFIG